MVQESWQRAIDEDREALYERKLTQAAEEVQYVQQRQDAKQTVLLEEGPLMREQLQDKVRHCKYSLRHSLMLCCSLYSAAMLEI